MDFGKLLKRIKKPEAMWLRAFRYDFLLAAHIGKALAAINRTVLTGLERHSGLLAAIRANRRIHFTFPSGGVLAGVAAGLAALGFIHKALRRVKLLLPGCEYKFLAAFLTDESLVLVHVPYLTSR